MPAERTHRLPRESYRGRVAVAFAACLRFEPGGAVDDEMAAMFQTKLTGAADKFNCSVVVWCLMPDHLHVIFAGRADDADAWRAMVAFKQQTGFWLAGYRPAVGWQRTFTTTSSGPTRAWTCRCDTSAITRCGPGWSRTGPRTRGPAARTWTRCSDAG